MINKQNLAKLVLSVGVAASGAVFFGNSDVQAAGDNKTQDAIVYKEQMDAGTYFFLENGTNNKAASYGIDNCVITATNGWNTIFDKKYYVKNNKWVIDKIQIIEGNSYYFDEKGIMVSDSLKTINGEIYYFDVTGKMAKTCWKTFGESNKYYFDKKGRAVRDRVKEINGESYGFDNEGIAIRDGLKTFTKDTYYFNKFGVAMKNAGKLIDGKEYYFGKDGKAVIDKL